MIFCRPALVLLAAIFLAPGLLPATPAVARPLSDLTADSCFEGLSSGIGVYPIVISLKNAGQSVDGNVVVEQLDPSGGDRRYLYPISLPGGAQKRLIAYPDPSTDINQIRVYFDGSRDFPQVTIPLRGVDQGMRSIGLIGDKVGGMDAIKDLSTSAVGPTYSSGITSGPEPSGYQPAVNYEDAYAVPEVAPDRAAGYESMTAVVVSDGAERMNGAQWQALHDYVLGGGTVIMLGGADASYLKVPDAQPLVPLTGIRSAVGGAKDLAPVDAAGVGPIALQTGDPKPGVTVRSRDGANVVVATERIGAGVVLFFAYNPIDEPLRGLDNIPKIWKYILSGANPRSAVWRMQMAASGAGDSDDSGYAAYGGGGYVSGGRYYSSSGYSSSSPSYADLDPANDPFKIKLPGVSTIVWMLLAYFVAVVPVTFFVLRKFRKLEWAWVTSPIISLLFAYGFYLFTADLYKAALSRRTAGLLTAQAGDPSARFVGRTEFFFPRGGGYPIKIPDAEAIELGNGWDGSQNATDFDTVDDGAVAAPDLSATNLSYRSLMSIEQVDWGGGVSASLRLDPGSGRMIGTITNGTGLPLDGAEIIVPGQNWSETIGNIPAGAMEPISAAIAKGSPAPLWAYDYLQHMPKLEKGAENTALLLARTGAATFGPQVGRDVSRNDTVAVMVSLPIGESRS